MIKQIKVYRVWYGHRFGMGCHYQYFYYSENNGLMKYDISELHEILPDQQKNPGLYKIKFIDMRFKP
tara:strand:- start:136 stop:336 length:201 start_codon:yes stop_codon:yes gene_type:complete